MTNLLKAEFYKLFHSRSFWGIVSFSFLLSSLLLLDSKQLTTNLFFASLYNIPLLYFLTIIFGALFIGDDFGEQTLHCFVSAGHKRSTILFTKAFTYQVACAIILAIPLIVHGLFGVFIQKVKIISIEFFLTTGFAIFVSMLAMCMLPLFCAFVFRDIGKTLTVPMVIFFVVIFILNNDQTQYITTILPIGQIRLISLQQLSIPIIAIVVIDVLWILILYIGAYFIFYCSDLK